MRWKAMLFSAAVFLVSGTSACLAQDAPAILTIQDDQDNELARFTPQELGRAFPMHDLVTATPWSEGGKVIHFRGVYLSDILSKYRFSGRDLEATATDNFVTTIPAIDIATYAPLVAISVSCIQGTENCAAGFRPLTIKDSGPFYIIWPLDKLPQYYKDTKNNFWVWFVSRLRPAEK